jgi:hypothetical protein
MVAIVRMDNPEGGVASLAQKATHWRGQSPAISAAAGVDAHSVQRGKERPRLRRGVDRRLGRLAVSEASPTTTSRDIIFTLRASAQGWGLGVAGRRDLLLVDRCPQSSHRVYTFCAQCTPWHPGGAF